MAGDTTMRFVYARQKRILDTEDFVPLDITYASRRTPRLRRLMRPEPRP